MDTGFFSLCCVFSRVENTSWRRWASQWGVSGGPELKSGSVPTTALLSPRYCRGCVIKERQGRKSVLALLLWLQALPAGLFLTVQSSTFVLSWFSSLPAWIKWGTKEVERNGGREKQGGWNKTWGENGEGESQKTGGVSVTPPSAVAGGAVATPLSTVAWCQCSRDEIEGSDSSHSSWALSQHGHVTASSPNRLFFL